MAYLGPQGHGGWKYPHVRAVANENSGGRPDKAATMFYTNRDSFAPIAHQMCWSMPFAMGPDLLFHSPFWYPEYFF